ncbi:hypothetical protein JOC85_000434 [Bacillus mesophilus]|uniref:Anti-sigma factor domain-containing protein n=1 Tax=Bacillus mesophilus TaxID=1808955 RepID=A0A6M0Q2W4_9BACI|nr:anti-sigma factor domain-containing protein [Bacillus mesophilus]MBM7659667.1 hypothetical protein [Bacillus mesophilus]NEY70534.1 anti-sigma factor domain-containing protein [Bacillus mesophilus]
MKKGVILEINAHYVTVLTPEGEFLKGRKVKEDYKIGEEIDFFPLNERAKAKNAFLNNFGKFRIAIASSVAAILLFFSAFSYYDSHQVYAYMSIDINPSIEVAVDKKLRVITLKSYNEEGKLILDSLDDWKNSSIINVTQEIIKHSKESGYYVDGAEVILATVVVDDEGNRLKKRLDEDVSNIAKSYVSENVLITVMDRKEEDRLNAIDRGLSTGKYVKEFVLAKENNQKPNVIKEDQKEKPVVTEKPVEEVEKELPKVDVKEKTTATSNQDDIGEQDNINSEKGNKKDKKGPPYKVKEKNSKIKESKKNDREDDDDEEDDDDDNNRGRSDRDNRDDEDDEDEDE